MAELRRQEVCADILRRIRLIVGDAASASRGGAKAADGHGGGGQLFKSMCESLLSGGRACARRSLDARLMSYSRVIDFAVRGGKVSEGWLCRLHSIVCGARHARAAPQSGRAREQSWQAGRYKDSTNKIVWERGRDLFGAPVERTASEMSRYCRELRGKAFAEAHPVLQASYAHHALSAVHPFVDGNGRVARLLAFGFIYRSNAVPMLPLDDDRVEYRTALRAADAGDFRPFITLVRESSVRAASLIQERITSAMRHA